jgi:two-component system, OmpR family, response regulator
MNILLVEDEARIADFVCAGLREQGWQVIHCAEGNSGMAHAESGGFDLLLLDIMVPGKDGLAILKSVRRKGLATPVMLLTARNELEDRVEGLNLGADDYLPKPFFVEELVARVHAIARRISGDRQNILKAGPVSLDRISREATVDGKAIEMTAREFTLLEYLARSPGRAFTRTQILEHVWGYDFDPNTNVVDVCIQRIRRKIDPAGAESLIEAVRGVGYRFKKA